MAVRVGFCHPVAREIPGGPGDVLNHYRFAQGPPECVAKDAGHDVSGATSGEARDKTNWPRRSLFAQPLKSRC